MSEQVLLAVVGLIGTAVTGISYRLLTLISGVLAKNTRAIEANTQAMGELRTFVFMLATERGITFDDRDRRRNRQEDVAPSPWPGKDEIGPVSDTP